MRKTLLKITLVTASATSVCPNRILAQDDNAYKRQVQGYLGDSDVVRWMQNHNYSLLRDGYRQGYIYIGRSQNATFSLEEGYTYAFVGACDSDCRSMSFTLYDPSGHQVATNGGLTDKPSVQVIAWRTGTYTLTATIPTCNGLVGCYWAVQALGK